MADREPGLRDYDDVPPDEKVTHDLLREMFADQVPQAMRNYLEVLSRPGQERCRMAVRGLGGLWWPCARPPEPGHRYCFAHTAG